MHDHAEKYAFRIRQYHFGVEKIRSKNRAISFCAKVFGKGSPLIQRFFGIERNADIRIAYGSNWASVTENFVRYLLEQKEDTIRRYRHSKCADEIFLQTILYNSPFRNRLYRTPDQATCNMRAIEWDDRSIVSGGPHVYDESDFPKIMRSSMLFARKFSSRYPGIVEKVRFYVKS